MTDVAAEHQPDDDVEHAEGVKLELANPGDYVVPDDGSDVTPEGDDVAVEHQPGGRYFVPAKGEPGRAG